MAKDAALEAPDTTIFAYLSLIINSLKEAELTKVVKKTAKKFEKENQNSLTSSKV